jgi:regulator of protease activity HflC (stomatin/prohibitin superfamily)
MSYNNYDSEVSVKSIIKWVSVGLVAVLLITSLFSSIYSIDPGFRGALTTLGKVEQRSYPNGVGFKWPYISSMTEIDVRTQKMEEQTSSYTSDVQTAQMQYVFTYDLRPDNVHVLYETVGMDYESKIVVPKLNDVLKDVVGKWQAQDLVSNRDKAREEVLAGLQAQLDSRFFQNISFQFINIDYSDRFEDAIESKVIAEQKAQEAVNNTKRIQEEAEQRLIKANAEVQEMNLKAKALNNNPKLIELEWINKWNGQLPQYSLGNSVPMINIGK